MTKLVTGQIHETSKLKSRSAITHFFQKIPAKLKLLARIKRYHKACKLILNKLGLFMVDGMNKFKDMKQKFRVNFKLKWQKFLTKLIDLGKEFNYPPFDIFKIKIITRQIISNIINDFFFCETLKYMKTELSEKITKNEKYIFNMMIIDELEIKRPYYQLYMHSKQYSEVNPLVDFLPDYKEKIKRGDTLFFTSSEQNSRRKRKYSLSESLEDKKVEILLSDNVIVAAVLLSFGVPSLLDLGIRKKIRSEQKMILI